MRTLTLLETTFAMRSVKELGCDCPHVEDKPCQGVSTYEVAKRLRWDQRKAKKVLTALASAQALRYDESAPGRPANAVVWHFTHLGEGLLQALKPIPLTVRPSRLAYRGSPSSHRG